MVAYRRHWLAGGTYFFTVTLKDRKSRWLVERIDDLKEAIRSVQLERPFRIDALVVLPEHLHTIWSLPHGDADYAARWQMVKARFSRRLAKSSAGISCNEQGEYNLWQRRYWEHTLRNERDLQQHMDYVYYNPVKHGWVRQVAQWPYSTFHRDVRKGIYPQNWAGGSDNLDDSGYGE